VLFTSTPTDEEWPQLEDALLSDLEYTLLTSCELRLVTLSVASEALCKEVEDHGVVLHADNPGR